MVLRQLGSYFESESIDTLGRSQVAEMVVSILYWLYEVIVKRLMLLHDVRDGVLEG